MKKIQKIQKKPLKERVLQQENRQNVQEIIENILEKRNFQDLKILNVEISLKNVQALKYSTKVWTEILQKGFFKVAKLQKFLKFQIETTFGHLLDIIRENSSVQISKICILQFLDICENENYSQKPAELFLEILNSDSRDTLDFFMKEISSRDCLRKFLKFLKDFCNQNDQISKIIFDNSFYILKTVQIKDDLKFQYSDAWVALLKKEMDFKTQKKVLKELPLKSLQDPRITADFFTDSLKAKGVLGILALDGIFLLITQYDLEYSRFYQELYLLLDEQVLHSKYKARFFSLTEKFLSSSLLPVNLVAAFIKKLARLALLAPPTGITFILPIIYNLLRSHHKCITMIQKPNLDKSPALETWDLEEEDPVKSGALDSSLWELLSLDRHYHFQIKNQISKFSSPLLSNQKVSDFLYETYDSFALKNVSLDTPIVVDINLKDLIF